MNETPKGRVERCGGCGKPLQVAQLVARVDFGEMVGEGPTYKRKREWCTYHRDCFRQAIGDPAYVMKKLRQIERANRKAKRSSK